jgi:hypothetical protein
MISEHWIRKDVNFTKYNKHDDDKIVLLNSKELCDEFLSYSDSYFKAAELIAEHLVTDVCENSDIATLDTWFFAVTYLYRQSLELILKATLYKYNINQEDIISKMRHDLAIGIELLDQQVGESTKSNANYIWLYKYLTNISDIDKESDMFRYPFNNKMEAFFREQKHYDYIAIYENVERAKTTLLSLMNMSIDTYIAKYTHEPTLLIEGGHYYQQAVIGYKLSQRDFYPYIRAYSQCANYLLELMNSNNSHLDLFLPMCYLFRNSIELELKKIYILHCSLNNKSPDLSKYKHRLLKLWKITQSTIDEHSNAPEDDTTVEDCSVYIEQLNNWDGCSSTFRYPINKNGDYFFKREKRYNFRNVGQCFNDINYFFGCVEQQLDYHLDIQMEMEAENWSNMDYDYY